MSARGVTASSADGEMADSRPSGAWTSGLSAEAEALSERTLRRVVVPLALLCGTTGAIGATLHVLFMPGSNRLWAAIAHIAFISLCVYWLRHPPRRIGVTAVVVAVYLMGMIGSFAFTGGSPALQHYGVLVVGCFYLMLDRRLMLATLACWLVAVSMSLSVAGLGDAAPSGLVICLISLGGAFALRYSRIRSIEQLVETRVSLERAVAARERALEKTVEQEKLASLGVMAAGVAHDYNNLLMGVVGGADLARVAGTEAERADALRMISTSAGALTELSQQLLEFAGGRPTQPVPLRIDRVVEDCVAVARARLPYAVSVTTRHAPDLPEYLGDRAGLRQLCLNLIANAIQAVGEAGSVTAETFLDGERVGLRVSDDGPGVPEEVRSRIFDPFFTAREGGRGLGLATVATVARNHDGDVRLLDGDPGSVFEVRLRLPVAPVAADDAEPDVVDRTSDPKSGTVLVIDDEPAVLRVTETMLRRLGFSTVTAGSGEEGLARAAELAGELSAVVVDARMPGMNGLEVARTLRASHDDLPIVLVSGQSPEDHGSLEGDALFNVFVSKPFRRDEIAEALASARLAAGASRS